VAELGATCRERGIVFHSDAVQWFGKEPFKTVDQFNADLVSVCAHKFHGPKGIGLLYVKSPLHPDPIVFGGGHENERRAGTENLAGVVGMIEAMERFLSPPVFPAERLNPLSQQLINCISKIKGAEFVGSARHRLSNTVAFVVKGTESIVLLGGLDIEGICASSGSACSAGSVEPSHVIAALGKPESARALVRLSLGRESTAEEVTFVCGILPEVIRRAQPGQ
jgi:cysteine desulfurase